MEDNQKADAVTTEQEFDLITEPFEEVETDDSDYGTELIEEESTPVTEEVVEESEEEAPIEEVTDIPNKENPSRFEFWQKKFSEEQNARKELEQKFQSLAEKLERPKTPEPEPLKPPTKPNSDDPLDKIEYQDKQIEYLGNIINNLVGDLNSQKEATKQAQEQAQFKAFMLGEYQKHGADEKLSAEAFNFFSSEQSLDPKTQMEIFMAWKGAPKKNPKVDQIKSKQQKFNTPLPPGVTSGQSDAPVEDDFGADLVNFQKTLH